MIASLKRINTLPLYSHIADIVSPTPRTLDIHLTQPDRWLPLLLGQVPAMILPREWETLSNFASHPIGRSVCGDPQQHQSTENSGIR